MISLILGLCYYTIFANNIEIRKLENFTELEVSNSINVVLQGCKKGEKPEARVEVNYDKLSVKDIVTHVSDGKLSIFIRKKPGFFTMDFNLSKKNNVTVYLKYENLNKIEVNSSARVITDKDYKMIAPSLKLEANSAAIIDLSVDIKELNINAESGAEIKLEGKSPKVFMTTTSAASVDMEKIEVLEADIKATSASKVKISVKNKLKACADSCAKIVYFGDPTYVDKEKNSMGKIEKFSEI